MNREFFCHCCSLYFWSKQYTEKEGILHRVKVTCPNEECELHKNPERGMLFTVDTMGFAYYVESNSERIQEIRWSSTRYAHPEAIEIYRKQGIPIREDL
ncbi:hypothetical protein ABH957_005553 [Bacillus sp. RC242]|uniref:hypothetical protein n=2 Tax=Bacillus TaxID=1386 RepID=UPI0038397CF7